MSINFCFNYVLMINNVITLHEIYYFYISDAFYEFAFYIPTIHSYNRQLVLWDYWLYSSSFNLMSRDEFWIRTLAVILRQYVCGRS